MMVITAIVGLFLFILEKNTCFCTNFKIKTKFTIVSPGPINFY